MSSTKIKLSVDGQILPGSISLSYLPCGKKTCPCATHPNKRHGPYFRWSGFIDGKRTTRNIAPQDVKECKRRIKNYQMLVKQWNKAMLRALTNAPWNKKLPKKPP